MNREQGDGRDRERSEDTALLALQMQDGPHDKEHGSLWELRSQGGGISPEPPEGASAWI